MDQTSNALKKSHRITTLIISIVVLIYFIANIIGHVRFIIVFLQRPEWLEYFPVLLLSSIYGIVLFLLLIASAILLIVSFFNKSRKLYLAVFIIFGGYALIVLMWQAYHIISEQWVFIYEGRFILAWLSLILSIQFNILILIVVVDYVIKYFSNNDKKGTLSFRLPLMMGAMIVLFLSSALIISYSAIINSEFEDMTFLDLLPNIVYTIVLLVAFLPLIFMPSSSIKNHNAALDENIQEVSKTST